MFAGYGLYLLFSLPALILGLWAQAKVKSAYNKYSRIRTYIGLTGAQIARKVLDSNGLQDIRIEQTQGILSDHYDPASKMLRLSEGVYQSNSIAAAGVAAHESGHAIQHREGNAMLKFRTAIVPTVQIGSWIGPIVFMIGLFLNSAFGDQVATVGLILFSATAVFALVTLPVELDASKKAQVQLVNSGLIMQSEEEGVRKVLGAAAWTYVAGAAQAISTIFYYAFLLFGRRRD
jgi:Zn-dependent membrane protease YugP